jgi:hypothetical protein
MRIIRSFTLLLCAACASGSGMSSGSETDPAAPPALTAIDSAQIREDLFALAGDAMRGREGGTLDELRASVWVARRAREAGLEPAGDDGTYFQWWSIQRTTISDASSAALDGAPLELWREAAVASQVDTSLVLPLVWIGDASGDSLTSLHLRGRAVAALLLPPSRPPESWVSLREWRYARQAIAERVAALSRSGASAIVLVAGDSTDGAFQAISTGFRRGSYSVDTVSRSRGRALVPVLWTPARLESRVREAKLLQLDVRVEHFSYPSVNIVAKVKGTDPELSSQFVLFSGHQDHDGVRYSVDGDSIWNGADDNASVSVAMLAIGRAMARNPAPRSALFVWHGSEERGLLGSRWFVAHPTVPLSSIVAVLNGDMIGRNSPDSAALLGVQPPHLNSRALARAALEANDRIGHFTIDSTWDRPDHAERWYFRSDHLPYARAGVPAVFFTTLLHDDYHTPRDGPELIDIRKLTRMARWMYATGWAVAAERDRPDVVPGVTLER